MEDLETESDFDLAALIAAARARWAELPAKAVRNTLFGAALVALTFTAWLVLRPNNSEPSASVIALNGIPELEVHAVTPAADRRSNIATPDSLHTTPSQTSATLPAATSPTEPTPTPTSEERSQRAVLATPDGVNAQDTPSTSPPSVTPPKTTQGPTTRPPTTSPPTTEQPTTTQQPTTTVNTTTTVIDTTTTLVDPTTTTEFCIRIRRRPPTDWCWKDRRG